MDFIEECIKNLTMSIVCYILLCEIWFKRYYLLNKIIIGLIFTTITSSVFVLLKKYGFIDEPYRTIIVIALITITFSIFLREKIEKLLVSLVTVYALGYILLLLGAFASYLILMPFNISDDGLGNIFRVSFFSLVSIFITLLLSKTKIDFSQIFNKFVNGIFISIGSIVIIFYGLLKEDISIEGQILLFSGFAALGYGIYSSIKRETVISNDLNARDIALKKQAEILAQKEQDILMLQNISEYITSDAHKKDKKLDGMKRAVEKVIMQSSQMDILDDARKILDEIEMSREKDARIRTEKLLDGITLLKTGLIIVDGKIETVQERAVLKNISFCFELNGDVSDFDLIIPQLELANIIGDLTENAFMAIKYQSIDILSKIKLIISNDNGCYELSLLDTGIPFNIETLVKLGTERVTSHREDGGSGCGYETIFELIYEYGASLYIEEYEYGTDIFSKKITIRFDNNEDFIVKSYRADAIKRQNANPNLVITT